MSSDNIFRIFGIDPGSDNLGISILDVNLITGKVNVEHAETFTGNKMVKRWQHIADIYGNKGAKLYGQREVLRKEFVKWQPHAVVVERPFVGRFANAIIALSECMAGIRESLICYNYNVPLDTIDPPTVKLSVGVKGNSKDKELMRVAIRTLKNATYSLSSDITTLDEHSCDAIAVAYWRYLELYGIAPVFVRAAKKGKKRGKRKKTKTPKGSN